MQYKQQHQQDVQAFLQGTFSVSGWTFSLPRGSGGETYFAQSDGRSYFVKLGAHLERTLAVARIGLTPEVLAAGQLEDGTSILVQPAIAGRKPGPKDFHVQLEQAATIVGKLHHDSGIKQSLVQPASDLYRAAALQMLAQLHQRWERYKKQVPGVAGFVDEALARLAGEVEDFSGGGLVASHNDICNANWLLSQDGRFYLVDLDMLALDDPANDLGALLWWYYPPALRGRFLEIAGYADSTELRARMRARMALHCLSILLPREQSFDHFDPARFPEQLTDFRAILAGEENPQGYGE
ncbi:MAG TPA: aminoglycoside phosphotransferase family protein [Ktedonobacterales bacterium]|nr:aminoglycoside phosphotransferase family protein [Ktedonobacterales bacterium]